VRPDPIVKAVNLLLIENDNAELIIVESSRHEFKPLKRYQEADSSTWAQPTKDLHATVE
jgi:hypothetical protein